MKRVISLVMIFWIGFFLVPRGSSARNSPYWGGLTGTPTVHKVPLQGKLGFPLKFDHFFLSTYWKGETGEEETEEKTAENWVNLKEKLMNNSIVFSDFPCLNSHEYEVGYGMEKMSVGEQLLYSLGFALLQMTAYQLDKNINNNSGMYVPVK